MRQAWNQQHWFAPLKMEKLLGSFSPPIQKKYESHLHEHFPKFQDKTSSFSKPPRTFCWRKIPRPRPFLFWDNGQMVSVSAPSPHPCHPLSRTSRSISLKASASDGDDVNLEVVTGWLVGWFCADFAPWKKTIGFFPGILKPTMAKTNGFFPKDLAKGVS